MKPILRPGESDGDVRLRLDLELTPDQLRTKEEFDAALQEAIDRTRTRVSHPWEADRSPRPSGCGHLQAPPRLREIQGCPEIIVRRCTTCGRDLWWTVDRWRLLEVAVRVRQLTAGAV